MSARFDLSQHLFQDLAPGDVLTPEAALAFATLAYFAAATVHVDPRELTLGHLVRDLQRGEQSHPLRRHNDPPAALPPLRHVPGCTCAICAARRRRVTA